MHYTPELLIQVVPATEDELLRVEGTAQSAAGMQGFDRSGFFVDGTVISTNLPPCDPEQPFPAAGPPVCQREPTWVKFDCGAYGGPSIRRNRLLGLGRRRG